MRLYIDIAIKLNDYTATSVNVDASNYAQASALKVTNQTVETMQRDRLRVYETLLHAAAYAEDGDTFSVKTSTSRKAFTYEYKAYAQPFSRIIDGVFLMFYANEEDVSANRVRLMKFSLRRFLQNEDTFIDTGLTETDFADYADEAIHFVKVIIGGQEELITAGRTSNHELVIHRLKDGTKHKWALPEDLITREILAFQTAANGIAISVQYDADMPRIYWIEEFDETTMEPIRNEICPPYYNVYDMDIGIAGRETIITTSSGQIYTTKGEEISIDADGFPKVLRNTNTIMVFNHFGVYEYGERSEWEDRKAEVLYLNNHPTDVTEKYIIGTGCNGMIISFVDGSEPGTAKKFSWRGLSRTAEQTNPGLSCGAYQFEVEINGVTSMTIYAQDPLLDYSLCKKINSEIVPVIHI